MHVATLLRDRQHFIAVIDRDVSFRPDLRGVRLERGFGFEHERQDLVVDRNQPQGLFRDVTVLGRHRRHRFSDETHRVIERVAAVLGDLLHLVVVLLATGDAAGTPDDLRRLVRQDRFHPRERLRAGGVDGPDAGVRMRATQHLRVEHPGQLHVVGVLCAARHALDCVDARRRVPDGVQCGHRDLGLWTCDYRAHWSPPALLRTPPPAATTEST